CSIDPLYELDPELELTLRRLRKARKIVVNNSSSSNFAINSNQLSIDISISSFSHFAEPGQMENNDRTLKELATLDVIASNIHNGNQLKLWSYSFAAKISWSSKRGPLHAFERIPRGLFHNETVGDFGRLYQDEGVPILTRWSCKGLVVPLANTFQHLGRHETHLSGEVLSGIQNCIHSEVNIWDKAAYKRDSTRILGEI
ncbi:hypothetical protein CR513_20308, partial [Mucuna pruriens]